MSEEILILSDIHGNISALNEVLHKISKRNILGIILLGDLINYGPSSNEVIERLSLISQKKVLVNIWGNHEHSIYNEEYTRFSTLRGSECARHTRENLSKSTLSYLNTMTKEGKYEFILKDKKCLAVHGSLEDIYWKSIDITNVSDIYDKYDFVFSGHSHIPHYITNFYKTNNSNSRNKKKTIFINPGSVGQPRNHNPNAQCALLDIDNESLEFISISYDIEIEVRKFSDDINKFYKERLKQGI